MIEDREIQAQIDDSLGLVSFREDTSDIELAAMAQRIQAQLQEAMQLSAKVKAMDNQVWNAASPVICADPLPIHECISEQSSLARIRKRKD